ncbi:MAG: M15 family metallopeptidase [Chthoniobacterales bacterium]
MQRLLCGRFLLSFCFLFPAWGSLCAAEPELINVRVVAPSIAVELRYAGTHNCAGKALYPPGMPALVRPEIARKLAYAQAILRPLGFRLKIWDAYRPKSAHDQLWQFSPISDYVADPAVGGSLHTWGVAVDATLVDSSGREVKMPTDFDDFSASAMLRYTGTNATVRRNLHALQSAMGRAGFYGMRTEWWHFVAKDWQNYRAVLDPVFAPVEPSSQPPPMALKRQVPSSLPPAVRPVPPAAAARATTQLPVRNMATRR